MPFNWLELLKLAKGLKKRSLTDLDDEALDRTVVGRAYYAAYCHARDHLERTTSFRPTGMGEDHARVRKALVKATQASLSGKLQMLRIWRNECDYDAAVPTLSRMVREAPKHAQVFFSTLK